MGGIWLDNAILSYEFYHSLHLGSGAGCASSLLTGGQGIVIPAQSEKKSDKFQNITGVLRRLFVLAGNSLDPHNFHTIL